MPWNLPAEYSNFLSIVKGNAVIMGRLTYEDHLDEIPNCLSIVVSQQNNYPVANNVHVYKDLAEAISFASQKYTNIFVIGGVNLITEALEQAHQVYETIVDARIEGDTCLPPIDYSKWDTKLIKKFTRDSKHKYAFKIYHHQRIIS